MTTVAESPPVVIEQEEAVAVIRLARPDKRNALDLTMRAAIADAMRQLERDASVRVVIITGGDEVFAAGADLNLLVDKGAQQVAEIDLGQYWSPVATSQKPLIAAVSGFALGAGCELALMCDFIIADPSARLGQPELNVGIMPGAGGTQRLVRTVGKQVASWMLMTAEPLSADRAHHLGLVVEVTEPGQLLPRAKQLARRIASMPPKALRATKRALAQGADLPLEAALSLENREFLLLFDTADKTEGMRAFLEKRKPVYQGR